jgi:hypothetical protein
VQQVRKRQRELEQGRTDIGNSGNRLVHHIKDGCERRLNGGT